MTKLKMLALAFSILICCASVASLAKYSTPASAKTVAAPSQDPQSLDRRISMLEQRLFVIESRLNRLEQQSAMSVRPPSTDQSRVENELMRNQVEILKGQISELGCGLAKLDERTLSANARQSRRVDSNAYRDPCRLNPETPLRLTAHP
jgi:hypothetical protein